MSNFLYHAPCPNCGSRDNLGVYDDHHYCFGCGYTKHFNPYHKYRNQAVIPQKTIWLPDDIETYIPYEAHEWLNRYTLTQKELLENKVVWSDSMKLLIFLYTENQVLKGWQGRYFGTLDTKPKWWNQGNLKDINLILTSSVATEHSLILVEDILSAIITSRLYNCKPLFGSYIDVTQIVALQNQKKYDKIVIWLDYDKQREARQFSKKLNTLGIPTYVIVTKKDPKEYTTDEIKEIYESQVGSNSSST